MLLLDAAFDLLGTEGWSATTVRGVCRAAQLHPRYFYQAFADLDDLLVSVFDRLIDQLGEEITTAVALAGEDPPARTRAGLGAVAHFVADDRRRARILYAEALGHAGLARRRLDSMQRFVDALSGTGTGDAGGAGSGGGGAGGQTAETRRAQVAAHIAVGGFTSVLVAWLDGRVALTLEQLVDDAAVLLMPMLP